MTPLQLAGAGTTLPVSAGGCVIVATVVAVQPFASVTVTVKLPAPKFDAVLEFPPEGAQEYVYPGEPPFALALTEPLFPPLQETLLWLSKLGTTGVGCVMAIFAVIVHPLESVTVTV